MKTSKFHGSGDYKNL